MKAGSHSYTLRLLDTFHGVHPVFHVSMLEPATPNKIPNNVQSPPPPVEVQGDLEYEISEVVDSKIDHHRSCKLLYLVCWLGNENTDEEFSWLPGAIKHQRTSYRLPLCISEQIRTSFKLMTFDPNFSKPLNFSFFSRQQDNFLVFTNSNNFI